jgi:hypothetical protein
MKAAEEIDVISIENGMNSEKRRIAAEAKKENSRACNRNKTFFCTIAADADRIAEQEARRNQLIEAYPSIP